jgi:hypothetical protein
VLSFSALAGFFNLLIALVSSQLKNLIDYPSSTPCFILGSELDDVFHNLGC